LLPAFDKRNLFAPEARDGWEVAMIPSFDASGEHMVVPWVIDPDLSAGRYFLAAYESGNPAWFAFGQPFDIDSPIEGKQAPRVSSTPSASQIIERLWRKPQSRRRRRRGRSLINEYITVFTASGTDSALMKAFEKARSSPEELWLGFLDMPSTQLLLANGTIVRELIRRVPLLEDHPAVKQLHLVTADDQSPFQVRCLCQDSN